VNPTINDPQRLELILEANPADKSPLMSLAMQELDQNRVAAAKQYLIDITTADPNNAEAQGLLGEVFADFEPDAFLEWNANLPQEVETDPGIWLARGRWLHANKHTPQAVRCLLEVVNREPENLSACTLLGQLLKSQGQQEQGNAFTERSRRLQRILDLNERIKEPRGSESVGPMIEELEATGRLWEAWGWCVISLQEQLGVKPGIATIRDRIAPQLKYDVPRTIAASPLAKKMDLSSGMSTRRLRRAVTGFMKRWELALRSWISIRTAAGRWPVRFISENIDATTRQRLAYIADGNVIGEF
jgi:hypothetical protein